jgi:hypothetical protein
VYHRILIAIVAVILLSGAGCQRAPVNPADKDDDIREVVYKYMFEQYLPELQSDVNIYFLALDSRTDPRSELLERFKSHTPPVKKVSASSRLGTGGIRDRSTGQKGVVFSVSDLRWIDDKEAVILGGVYQGGEAASSTLYHVEWMDGEWVVTEEDMDFIP